MTVLRRLWLKLAERRPVAVAVALVLLAFVLGLWAGGENYVRHNPKFCTRACHAPNSRHAAKSLKGHKNLACQACHAGGNAPGLGLAFKSIFGTANNVGSHAALDPTSCSNCHSARPDAELVADTLGHRQHAGPRQPTPCVQCHSQHSARRAVQACTNCHADAKLHAKRPDADTCLSCHNFSIRSGTAQKLTVLECNRCHGESHDGSLPTEVLAQARRVTPQMLHGSVDCKLCHNPHRSARPASSTAGAPEGPAASGQRGNDSTVTSASAQGFVAQQPCHKCHEIQLGPDAAKVPVGHVNCAKCHRQHAPLQEARVACVECHEQGRDNATTGAQGRRHRSCSSCHVPHDWHAERSGCVHCHKDKAESLLTRSPEGHAKCVSCHEIHGPVPDGRTCVTCHRDRSVHLANAPATHRNCATCHDPHAASNPDRKVCLRCHSDQERQIAGGATPKHAAAGCLGCHEQHGNPAVGATRCRTCHTDKAQLVAEAGPEPHRRCVSCHQPHQFKVQSVENTCGRCHSNVTAQGIHGGPCTKCHQPHGSPAVVRSACLSCHEAVKKIAPAENAPHGRCGSCHQPHRSATAAPLQCPSCHQDKAKIAALWPAGSAHAGACTNCHEHHQVRQIKSCESCHVAEGSAAHGPPHRCTQCHQPHQEPAVKGGWWTRCNNCHAAKVAATQAGGPHKECQNCHKPHAFARPACTDCHKSIVEQGAHRVPAHKKCTACHDAHTASRPEREQCVKCHEDRKTHMADVRRCQGCHMFKG